MVAFEKLASIYDSVMDDAMYDDWLELLFQTMSSHSMIKILDLGCGTGELSLRLLKDGYDVVGLDQSKEMLSIASQKAQAAGLYFPIIEGDMRDLDGIGNFQRIVSFSDTLCYLASFDEFEKVFQEVFKHLTDDGIFIFDLHSLYQINHQFPEFSFNRVYDDAVFVWNSYQQKVNTIHHDLTFFLENDLNQMYERYDELHIERTFPKNQIKTSLKSVGFKEVEILDGQIDEKSGEALRWYFICQK